jgi:hypothetical protein
MAEELTASDQPAMPVAAQSWNGVREAPRIAITRPAGFDCEVGSEMTDRRLAALTDYRDRSKLKTYELKSHVWFGRRQLARIAVLG